MAKTRQSAPEEGADEETTRFVRLPGLPATAFVELLSSISAKLIDMPAQRIDREIPRVLSLVVESFHLDRGTVWEIAEHRRGFRVTHSFTVDGIEELPGGNVGDWFPYLAGKALASEPIRCNNLRELPDEAARDREMLERVGQQSLLLFPFRVGGSYVGAVSFGTVHRECQWADDLVDKLHVVSRAIATTLARKQADEAMEASRDHLAEVQRIVELGTCQLTVKSGAMTGSRQFYRLFDIDQRAELDADMLLARVHADDRPGLAQRVATLVEGDSDGRRFGTLRVVRTNGEIRHLQAWADVLRGPDERPYKLLGVAQDITRRKRSEEALRQLSSRLLQAQEEERTRIARELHDDLSQRMALLNMEIDLLAQSAGDARLESELTRLSERVGELASSVRKLSHALHPSALQHLGLVAAVDQLRREIARLHGLDIEYEHRDMPARLTDDAALSLYRIAQEALRNVVKHSQGEGASVSLHRKDTSIELTVSDNGVGFDMESPRREPGLGMLGMRERLRLVRGRLSVRAKPGRGTKITAIIPIAGNVRPPTLDAKTGEQPFSLPEETRRDPTADPTRR